MLEGNARPLRPELIHDVFWLRKPSATLVVRCTEHPGAAGRKPRSFWAPGLALVPKAHHDTSIVTRRAEGLALMGMANQSLYEEALCRTLEGPDPSLAYYAFTAAAVSAPTVLDKALNGLTRPNPRPSPPGGGETTDRAAIAPRRSLHGRRREQAAGGAPLG